jgi:hypothetical protein
MAQCLFPNYEEFLVREAVGFPVELATIRFSRKARASQAASFGDRIPARIGSLLANLTFLGTVVLDGSALVVPRRARHTEPR